MTSRYFLGEEGEAAYKRLEHSLRLGPGSGRALVASDSVDVRYEVRRRVAEILATAVVRPGADVVRKIHEVVEASESTVLVWIEGEAGVGVEAEAWRQTYAALNMGRDVLAKKGALSLVLAGPRGLEDQVAVRAPDLRSVMRPILVLGTRLDLVAEPSPVGGPRDLDELCVRLRRRAVERYRMHAVPRLSDGAPKPQALLSRIFVPLDFEEHEVFVGRLRSTGRTIDLGILLKTIDPTKSTDHDGVAGAAAPRRLVAILGDPGSGKSTLCRWLARSIAQREQGRVPIVVEVVDWMSRGDSGDLLDAMTRAADSGVSGSMTVDDLRSLCSAGRIVLLLDGLDELVRPRARTRVRAMLSDFSVGFPQVTIVATSRIEGFAEQAPLPAPFQTFVVEPFDEGQLEEFVRCWYELVEPDDAEARARGRAELTAALAAEPRARAMACNPLLATLVASVHQTRRAPLPSRRSELYALVVDLLLEEWPEQRGRVFSEIGVDDQRSLLERFALWLQEQRSAEDGEDIVFDRDAFVRQVTEVRAGHESISTRRAQQWLEWLVRETGLLVEARDGRYSFLHLSLMEYLAGSGALAR